MRCTFRSVRSLNLPSRRPTPRPPTRRVGLAARPSPRLYLLVLHLPRLVYRHSSFLSPRLKSCRRHAVRPPSLVDAHKSARLNTCQAVSCMSCSTPHQSGHCSVGLTFFVGHVAAYGPIRFSFVRFSLSCLRLHLVALFFSFPLIDIAIRLLASPLFLTLRPPSRID